MIRVVLYVIASLCLIVSCVFGALKCSEVKRLKNDLTLMERSFKEMKVLKDNLVVSSSRMITKESFDKEIKKLTDKNVELKKELSNKKEVIKYRTLIKTITKYVTVRDVVSDKVEVKDKIKIYSKELTSDKGLALANVKFKHPTSKPWSYTVYPINTKITVIQSDNNGVPKIIVQAVQTDKNKKEVPMKIVDVETIIRKPSIKDFSFGLNPFRLELYGLYGFHQGTLSNGIGVGLGSHFFHLKIKEKEALRFVGFIAGYQAGSISLTFNPVSLNLSTFIPILKDTYITLGLGGAFILNDQKFSPLISIGIGSTL